MPRSPRIHQPGGYYHVTLRGNHRHAIFRDDADRRTFGELLAEALLRFGARAHAYCWMTNHVHLVAQVGEAPLGRVVQSVASRYARRFQKAIPTTGHLFERRYRASLIAKDSYLLEAVRYVHMNPVAAGIVVDAARYAWSSHAAYLGGRGPRWLTTSAVLGMLGDDQVSALRAYRALMAATTDATAPDAPQPSRATASSATSACLDAADRDAGNTLDALIATRCAQAGIEVDSLASGSCSRRLSDLRATIAAEALRAELATLSQIAQRFDRSVASLSRLLQRRVLARPPPGAQERKCKM
jgi:REP-associated tyrosine transposase